MTKGTKEALWKNANHHKTQMPPMPERYHSQEREKNNGTQKYLCKDREYQFISDQEKTYRGCLSG
jgi:hypothetical protein